MYMRGVESVRNNLARRIIISLEALCWSRPPGGCLSENKNNNGNGTFLFFAGNRYHTGVTNDFPARIF